MCCAGIHIHTRTQILASLPDNDYTNSQYTQSGDCLLAYGCGAGASLLALSGFPFQTRPCYILYNAIFFPNSQTGCVDSEIYNIYNKRVFQACACRPRTYWLTIAPDNGFILPSSSLILTNFMSIDFPHTNLYSFCRPSL